MGPAAVIVDKQGIVRSASGGPFEPDTRVTVAAQVRSHRRCWVEPMR